MSHHAKLSWLGTCSGGLAMRQRSYSEPIWPWNQSIGVCLGHSPPVGARPNTLPVIGSSGSLPGAAPRLTKCRYRKRGRFFWQITIARNLRRACASYLRNSSAPAWVQIRKYPTQPWKYLFSPSMQARSELPQRLGVNSKIRVLSFTFVLAEISTSTFGPLSVPNRNPRK